MLSPGALSLPLLPSLHRDRGCTNQRVALPEALLAFHFKVKMSSKHTLRFFDEHAQQIRTSSDTQRSFRGLIFGPFIRQCCSSNLNPLCKMTLFLQPPTLTIHTYIHTHIQFCSPTTKRFPGLSVEGGLPWFIESKCQSLTAAVTVTC